MPKIEATIDEKVAKFAGDPQKVADSVLHVLTVEKPHLRYLVGTDAQLMGNVHRFLGFGGLCRAVPQALHLEGAHRAVAESLKQGLSRVSRRVRPAMAP